MGIKGIFLVSMKNITIYLYYIWREYIILWVNFSLSIILLNKFAYKNDILLVSLKMIRIYITLLSLKKISIVCYNMKVTNLYYIVGIIENNKNSY